MSSTETIRARLFNPRTKKIFIIVGIVIAVLGAAFMVYAIIVTPSRQPYRTALTQYKSVYNANVAVMVKGASLNASTATNEQFVKSTEAVKAALLVLKSENEALGRESVLTSGEGKERYESFSRAVATYIAFNLDMVASMQKVRPVIFACSQSMANISENAAGAAAMQACSTHLAELESVPNKEYQLFVTTSQKLYADFATNVQAKAELKEPQGADSAQATALSDEQTTILNSLSTASKTFSTNLQSHKKAVDITDAAMALDAYLNSKSRIF